MFGTVLVGCDASESADDAVALGELTGLARPCLHSFLARSLFASRLFNVTVTNG